MSGLKYSKYDLNQGIHHGFTSLVREQDKGLEECVENLPYEGVLAIIFLVKPLYNQVRQQKLHFLLIL